MDRLEWWGKLLLIYGLAPFLFHGAWRNGTLAFRTFLACVVPLHAMLFWQFDATVAFLRSVRYETWGLWKARAIVYGFWGAVLWMFLSCAGLTSTWSW